MVGEYDTIILKPSTMRLDRCMSDLLLCLAAMAKCRMAALAKLNVEMSSEHLRQNLTASMLPCRHLGEVSQDGHGVGGNVRTHLPSKRSHGPGVRDRRLNHFLSVKR